MQSGSLDPDLIIISLRIICKNSDSTKNPDSKSGQKMSFGHVCCLGSFNHRSLFIEKLLTNEL